MRATPFPITLPSSCITGVPPWRFDGPAWRCDGPVIRSVPLRWRKVHEPGHEGRSRDGPVRQNFSADIFRTAASAARAPLVAGPCPRLVRAGEGVLAGG